MSFSTFLKKFAMLIVAICLLVFGWISTISSTPVFYLSNLLVLCGVMAGFLERREISFVWKEPKFLLIFGLFLALYFGLGSIVFIDRFIGRWIINSLWQTVLISSVIAWITNEQKVLPLKWTFAMALTAAFTATGLMALVTGKLIPLSSMGYLILWISIPAVAAWYGFYFIEKHYKE